MRKKLLIAFVVVILLIQLFQPTKNIHPNADANNIASIYSTPDNVKKTLQTSCYDCHSNNTVYPWYGVLQPAAWWMSSHVNDGKKELNFDEFASYSPRKQYHKLESFIKVIKEDGMPLDSYTWIHKNAILSSSQKQVLMDWAAGIRTQMQQHYPADSLARKK